LHESIAVNPFRSVQFRYNRFSGWLALSISGVTRRGPVDAIGIPTVSLFPGSEIVIGKRVRIVSKSFATALGVNHGTVLRTLRSEARIQIGDGVGISGGSICAAKSVVIGEDTRLGANVTIADTDFHSLSPHLRAGHADPSIGVKPVDIGKCVLIGTNAIILKGVTIGDNSVIGAGSVVTSSIPSNTIAAGNPCKVIRSLTVQELAP
jgi:acetyltransferase-like isoleucine patch superfamily enzyme